MGQNPQNDARAAAKTAALNLLARREHGRCELQRKLRQRGHAEQVVEELLDDLAACELQSDRRFAEAYVRYRAAKAYGPLKIGAELGQKGVGRELIDSALNQPEVDWSEILLQWIRRRTGLSDEQHFDQRSADYRRVLRRGFSHQQIRQALRANRSD